MTVELYMDNIEAFFADPDGRIGQIIREKTVEVETVAKGLLLLPGGGRTYLPGVIAFVSGGKFYTNWATGGTDTAHTASAPGAPPATQTGALFGSISHRIGVDGTVYGIVGSPDPVALYQEKGTHRRDGTVGLEPRPFLVPALHMVLGA